MKNYDYWKKSQITDISTFCYWLHQKGVGIYVDIILGDSLFLDSDIIKFSHTDLMSWCQQAVMKW